jgi:hypothetical protein
LRKLAGLTSARPCARAVDHAPERDGAGSAARHAPTRAAGKATEKLEKLLDCGNHAVEARAAATLLDRALATGEADVLGRLAELEGVVAELTEQKEQNERQAGGTGEGRDDGGAAEPDREEA